MLCVYLNRRVPFPQSVPRVCPPSLRPSERPRCLQSIWAITRPPGGKMENVSAREHRRGKNTPRVPSCCSRSQAKRVEVEVRHREAQMMLACRPGTAWGGRERWRILRLRRKGWSCTGPTDDNATSHTERGSVERSPARKRKQRVEMFAERT